MELSSFASLTYLWLRVRLRGHPGLSVLRVGAHEEVPGLPNLSSGAGVGPRQVDLYRYDPHVIISMCGMHQQLEHGRRAIWNRHGAGSRARFVTDHNMHDM